MDPSAIDNLEQRLVRCRVQLALRQPFLASALFRLPLIDVRQADWCPTMGTDGWHIFYNPNWVSQLSDAEIQGVLAHELLHVVFAHAGRVGDRDRQRWNMACDFAINGMLDAMGFDLPAGGLLDHRHDGNTSEEIYDWLRSKKGFDAFNGSDLFDGQDPRIRSIVPGDAPDSEGARALQSAVRDLAKQGLGGALSQMTDREFGDVQNATIDWRSILNQLLTDTLTCDWASIPFAKKHLHRGLYLPSMSKPQPGRVVFAIDTSGSVTDDLIDSIMSELMRFQGLHEGELAVVQCDDAIRHVLRINAQESGAQNSLSRMGIKGRGGTDFAPVFDWADADAQDCGPVALLVYATDGAGRFPAQQPDYPVLWLLTPGSVPPSQIPFGVVARMGKPAG